MRTGKKCKDASARKRSLTNPKKKNDSRKGINSCFNTNKFSSNIFSLLITRQTFSFFSVLRNIDCCDLLRSDVPIDPEIFALIAISPNYYIPEPKRNHRPYNITIFATVVNKLPHFLIPPWYVHTTPIISSLYHLTRSTGYLSRENFIFQSLSKSTNLSLDLRLTILFRQTASTFYR